MSRRLEDVGQMVGSLKLVADEVLPDQRHFDFEVCATEALTNLVQHKPQGEVANVIDVALSYDENLVQLEIFDPEGSVPFDPIAKMVPLSEVDLMSESGRGLGLIQNCADKVDYGSLDGRNRLKMCFGINSPV